MSEEIEPLTPAQERAWRALARALITVPRAMDADLEREQRMTMAEYFVLMNLSEAPDRALRMSELAARGGLSPSRISRLVDTLAADGLVRREPDENDRRVQIAVLTDEGMDRLVRAYPSHLASVRRHVVDHFEGLDLEKLAEAAAKFGVPRDR
jgi:DNA-binding MarR family transcriptional regulator